jgi:hypothetical protein
MPQNDADFNRGVTCTPPRTPRWVKVFGMIAIVAVLLFIIMLFVGGGQHGPGRHLPSGGTGDYIVPVAHGAQQR